MSDDESDDSAEMEELLNQAKAMERQTKKTMDEELSSDDDDDNKPPRKPQPSLQPETRKRELLDDSDDDEVQPEAKKPAPVVDLLNDSSSSDEEAPSNAPGITTRRGAQPQLQNQQLLQAQLALNLLQQAQQASAYQLEQQLAQQVILNAINNNTTNNNSLVHLQLQITVKNIDTQQQMQRTLNNIPIGRQQNMSDLKQKILAQLQLPASTRVDLWYRSQSMHDTDTFAGWNVPAQAIMEATLYLSSQGQQQQQQQQPQQQRNLGAPITLSFRIQKETTELKCFMKETFDEIRSKLASKVGNSHFRLEFDGLTLRGNQTPESQDMEDEDLIEVVL